MKRFKHKGGYALYFSIAFGSTLAQWPDPLTWRAWLSALLAGLIALKAKGSKSDEPDLGH